MSISFEETKNVDNIDALLLKLSSSIKNNDNQIKKKNKTNSKLPPEQKDRIKELDNLIQNVDQIKQNGTSMLDTVLYEMKDINSQHQNLSKSTYDGIKVEPKLDRNDFDIDALLLEVSSRKLYKTTTSQGLLTNLNSKGKEKFNNINIDIDKLSKELSKSKEKFIPNSSKYNFKKIKREPEKDIFFFRLEKEIETLVEKRNMFFLQNANTNRKFCNGIILS